MSLEPTGDQMSHIANALAGIAGIDGIGPRGVLRVWALIRDMVLEEAAKRLDSGAYTAECTYGCVEEVCGMKGKQP